MNIMRGMPDSTSSTGETYLRWLSDIEFGSGGNREKRRYAFPPSVEGRRAEEVSRVRLVDGEEGNDA